MVPGSFFSGKDEKKVDTILIVDDSEINRAILNNIFSGTYEIEEAENGREGMDKFLACQDRLCAVLLDIVMPVMDGVEVLHEFEKLDVFGRIPVFLITAETDNNLIKEAYKLGVMGVIGKPFSTYVVERRINSIIELYQARKRLSGVVEQQQQKLLEQARELAKMSIGMIESLSTAIEFRSGESGEHVRRIRDITAFLLRETEMGEGLSDTEINRIALAAVMHDVGKIAIPDAILNKPGRLTPEEYEIMKTHTTQGKALLEKIPQMQENEIYDYALDIALHHHERWDGRGYPEGLKGDEISTWSQVVSIADVYDALVSERVYKKAFSPDKAKEMILGGECGSFNPQLLKCFDEAEGRLRKLYTERKPV